MTIPQVSLDIYIFIDLVGTTSRVYIYIYIYIERERERERAILVPQQKAQLVPQLAHVVSCGWWMGDGGSM